MNAMEAKKVSDSHTQQVHIVRNTHINGYNRLFGGQLMSWIDTVGGVVARRHSGCEVTTAAIDSLVFHEAVAVNNTLVLDGCVTFTGHTSMEVRVDTFVEQLNGERHRVNRAYLVFVAIDEQQRPTAVPPLVLETDEEKQEYQNGELRQQLRKQRRKQGY